MKPRNIAIACGVAGVTVGLAAAAGIVYRKQIKSAASLKRLTGYADGYDLHAIDIAYGYDLDRIIAWTCAGTPGNTCATTASM